MPGRWARPFPHGSLIPLREDVDLLVLDRLATMRASLVFRRQLAAAIGAHELGTRFRESPRLGTFGCGDIRDNAHEIMNRSEEHTSELQSRQYLVCRLLLEKKKYHTKL